MDCPTWNSSHTEDVKWSSGLGVRSMINHLVVRLDVAASEEDVIAQLFIGHPLPTR